MGTFMKIQADDGHELGVYVADPTIETRGHIVVIQRFSALPRTSRRCATGLPIRGIGRRPRPSTIGSSATPRWTTIRPGSKRACPYASPSTRNHLDWVMLDVKATADHLGNAGAVGIVGYCFGGLVAWLAACRLEMGCASSYYGRTTELYADEKPKCPVICHFGERDQTVPPSVGEAVKANNPLSRSTSIPPITASFVTNDPPTMPMRHSSRRIVLWRCSPAP